MGIVSIKCNVGKKLLILNPTDSTIIVSDQPSLINKSRSINR